MCLGWAPGFLLLNYLCCSRACFLLLSYQEGASLSLPLFPEFPPVGHGVSGSGLCFPSGCRELGSVTQPQSPPPPPAGPRAGRSR